MNAVEREPVPIRVLNSNASEASYKPKQHRYRKTGYDTVVENTLVECTFVEGTLIEWNIGRMEHWSNGTFV